MYHFGIALLSKFLKNLNPAPSNSGVNCTFAATIITFVCIAEVDESLHNGVSHTYFLVSAALDEVMTPSLGQKDMFRHFSCFDLLHSVSAVYSRRDVVFNLLLNLDR